MADPSPRWHGDNYQSRHFWLHAAALLDESRSHVVEVTFEAQGPKAFDDVVVHYDPPRRSSTSEVRVPADFYQIKWHTNYDGYFGYEDLVNPKFIGATTFSVLERLRDAKLNCPLGSAFHFVTTYRVSESDALNRVLYGVDNSIRIKTLFDGTGDGSEMGKIRKCWREHLGLTSDEELRKVVESFHIEYGAKNLEKLREDVSIRFRIVGLDSRDHETAFIYDEFARYLVTKNIRSLNRARFRAICEEEGWFLTQPPIRRRGVSVQSYTPRRTPADLLLAAPDQTLQLSEHFDDRWLKMGERWDDVRDRVIAFLRARLAEDRDIRLFLEAPTSLAFLAGACLGAKSGASVEVVQIGFGNSSQVWDADDGSQGPPPEFNVIERGDGKDVALVMSFARNALPKAQEFIERALPDVGCIIHATSQGGTGPKSIAGGEHALSVAHKVSEAVSDAVRPGGRTHLFLSVPNALSFYLGQQAGPMGLCVPYEFDFKKQKDASYVPSFEIDPNAS